MIDKVCLIITNRIQDEMNDIDDERAEIINYGLHLMIGELPKTFIILAFSYFLGVFKLTLFMILMLLPYRTFSGGFHLKTHIGCIISTTIYYCGISKISKIFILYNPTKLIILLCIWLFGIIIIRKYAPADTENVPILRENERRQKRALSYIFFTIGLIIAAFVSNNEIANILILGNLLQTCMITPIAYKLTKNKYGYEMYERGEKVC